MRPILGLMWTPKDKNYSIGLTLSNTIVLSADTFSQLTDIDFWNEGSEIYDYTIWNGADKRSYPVVATLGYAYFPSASLLFSADITYYTATIDPEFGDRKSLINAALGMEYYYSSTLALRGGLFTNFASTYGPDSGKAYQPEKVDLYGASLSVSFFTQGKSITVGSTFSRGSGITSIGQWRNPRGVNDMTIETYSIFIGASTAI